MNILVFALTAWVCFGLELGLKQALEIGHSGMAPSFVFVLLTFVSMFAPSTTALWAALALGIIMDLTGGVAVEGANATAVVLGPHALGYVLAAQFVLALRAVMNRRNPLSIAAMALFASLVAHAVVVTFYAVHRWYGEPLLAGTKDDLLARLGSSAYTGAAALALSLLLLPMQSLFGFATPQQRRFGGRVIR